MNTKEEQREHPRQTSAPGPGRQRAGQGDPVPEGDTSGQLSGTGEMGQGLGGATVPRAWQARKETQGSGQQAA